MISTLRELFDAGAEDFRVVVRRGAGRRVLLGFIAMFFCLKYVFGIVRRWSGQFVKPAETT